MNIQEEVQRESTNSGHNHRDIDIVVVAFNEAERIALCLQALLNQATELVYRVVVVDDGSLDETSKIVQQIQVDDSRLSLIRHDVNLGRGAARRTGQDASRAPRIAFVDADIVVPLDWLQRCTDALEGFSAVSAVALPDGDSAVIWRIFRPTIRIRVGFTGIAGGNVLFDAAALRTEPFGSHYKLGEDFRLAHRLLRRGFKLKILEDLHVEHRESKSYRCALKYTWETGVDAASHPFEFRIIRLPDVIWLISLIWSLASIVAVVTGWWTWWLGFLSLLSVALVTTLFYTFSRFRIRPGPLRWIGSAFGNFPLIILYFAGRTWGLAILSMPQRRRVLGL